MTFSEEIEDEIKEFVSRTENIYYFPDSNYGVEYLNNNFSVLGTKLDLSKLPKIPQIYTKKFLLIQ